MKKFAFVILLLFPLIGFSQAEKRYRSIIIDSIKALNGNIIEIKDFAEFDTSISIGGNIEPSAIANFVSIKKGFLMPRVTTTQRDNIPSPAEGLMVYNTTTNAFNVFDVGWQAIGGGAGNTIYSADDNLAGNRTVTMGANSLTFSGNQTTFKGVDATSSNFVVKHQDNVSTELFNVRNDGNVGIGTLPNSPTNERLVVKGSGVGTVVIGQVFGITQLGAIGVHGSLSQTAYTLAKNNNTTDVLLNVPTAAGKLIFREAGVDRAVFSQTSFSTKTKMKLGVSGGADPLSQLETRNTVNGENIWSAAFFDDTPFAAGVGGGIYFLGRVNATIGESGFAAIRGIKANGISDDVLGELQFLTGTNGNTEAMRIDELGNVGIGTTSPATSAKLEVSSTTGALLFPRMTTAQRDALTAVDGMVVYNTSLSKLQVRAGGSWISLH